METGVKAPACSKCGVPLVPTGWNSGTFTRCVSCGAEQWVEVFPALVRPPATGRNAEASVVTGESTCFYHDAKRAVVVCDACGRFLCALCDCVLHERHLCPGCLESGKKKGAIAQLETVRVLYGRQAFVLSLLPLFISGIAAIALALRHWKTPGSLVAPARWMFPTALVLGILQTLVFAGWFAYLILG